MVVFKGYYDINLVEYLKDSFVYFNKEDLKLDENTYLAIDLIGFDVIIEDKKVGNISSVLESTANEILVLDNNIKTIVGVKIINSTAIILFTILSFIKLIKNNSNSNNKKINK